MYKKLASLCSFLYKRARNGAARNSSHGLQEESMSDVQYKLLRKTTYTIKH